MPLYIQRVILIYCAYFSWIDLIASLPRNNTKFLELFFDVTTIFELFVAQVAELVDARDSKSRTVRCEGSIPSLGTMSPEASSLRF